MDWQQIQQMHSNAIALMTGGFGFYSEIGLPHVPSVESMRTMMPESDLWPVNATGMWSYHQIDSTNTSGGKYLKKIESEYGESTGIEQFCQKAAALNYNYNRAIMEAAGNSMWKGCNGVLLWMSKSAWANLNWSTYDYYNGVDGTYFGVKKACEPVHIQWDLRTWQVSVVNATRTDLNRLTAVAQVYDLNGTLTATQSSIVNAAANQVTDVFTIKKPTGLSATHFIRLLLKNGEVTISKNFYWDGNQYENYTALNSLDKVTLDLSASARTIEDETVLSAVLKNPTPVIAFMARISLMRGKSGERVLPTFYSDNYLSLLPGESETLIIRCKTADLADMDAKLNLDGFNIGKAFLDVPLKH